MLIGHGLFRGKNDPITTQILRAVKPKKNSVYLVGGFLDVRRRLSRRKGACRFKFKQDNPE